VRDQSHGHGDIQAVLREEPSHIAPTVTGNTSFRADVLRGDQIQEAEDEEENESGKKKMLTFHCVYPQKNGS
jgi:hypothetical protein